MPEFPARSRAGTWGTGGSPLARRRPRSGRRRRSATWPASLGRWGGNRSGWSAHRWRIAHRTGGLAQGARDRTCV